MPVSLRDAPFWWAREVQVPPASLSNEANTQYRSLEISFETNEQMAHRVYFDQAVTIVGWRAQVTKAIAATDDATITLKNSAGSNMTPNAVLTLAASTAIATVANQTGTAANNTVAAGDYAQLVAAKTTAGGKARVTLVYRPA